MAGARKTEQNTRKHIESALGNGLNELERCNVKMTIGASQKKENLRFFILILSCLELLKERRIPSLDLILLSRDSTMGNIYRPRAQARW